MPLMKSKLLNESRAQTEEMKAGLHVYVIGPQRLAVGVVLFGITKNGAQPESSGSANEGAGGSVTQIDLIIVSGRPQLLAAINRI